MVRFLGLVAIVVALLVLRDIAAASHGPGGTQLWGYEAALSDARILNYDVGTHSAGPNCLPPGTINGRGIAYDPFDGGLW